MNQVRPGLGDMQSMKLIDQIYPEYPNLPKIISQCKTDFKSGEVTVGFSKYFL